MMDLVYIGAIMALFLAILAFAHGCGKLGDSQ
jgi:hypothetical protein